MKTKGMALVLVLSFLALISILVVAFFSSVMTEVSASKSYANGVGVKQLSDSVNNIVIGLIKDATTTGSSAWASQPGMIRTYGTDGKPIAYYKLYSSNKSKITDLLATYDSSSDVQADWDQKPALYTDLNCPIFTADPGNPSTTKPVFPIIDPRAYSLTTGSNIEGFSYSTSGSAPNGIVMPGENANDQRLPMPVRWMYVLQDGSITVPSGYANGAATWSAGDSTVPSDKNPIVGRIAYWTDDETCKLNINTAAGDLSNLPDDVPGAFWDIPRVDTPFDRKCLARQQPFQYEFERYPGHPATLSLSNIFPNLTRSDIRKIAPRINGDGSLGGTEDTYGTTLPALSLDADRLYASADELIYAAPNAGGSAPRTENSNIDPTTLEKAKFFITAHNSSPDLNLFGQPRICIWPINNNDSSTYRTSTDKLIAFCSTVGDKAYYFTRSDPTSATADYNLLDPKGRLRNQQLYSLLQSATGKAIPGFGGAGYTTKYGDLERDQILTEIYDYIRSTNLHDGLLTSAGTYTPPAQWTTASGQVVPIQIDTANGKTGGFGRFHIISQAAILFYASDLATSGSVTTVSKMRAALLFSRFNVASGYAGCYPNFQYYIPDLPVVGGTSGNFNSSWSKCADFL